MEWLSSIRTAINYMEEHLTDDISAQDVADRIHLSPFFLQKGFSLMTGYGIGEYLRNRRLYQAALDLRAAEAGDPEAYCEAWLQYQSLWMAQLPGLPVYTNVYWDFYTGLQDYPVDTVLTWSQLMTH